MRNPKLSSRLSCTVAVVALCALPTLPAAGTGNVMWNTLSLGGRPSNHTGIYGLTEDGELFRSYREGTGWRCEPIPHYGGAIVAGSLISGPGRIFGVNEYGTLFNTWIDQAGVARFDLITDSSQPPPQLVPGSLALGGSVTHHTGVYGVSTSGDLIHASWNGSWGYETIPHYGGDLDPASLISGDHRVYGLTTAGRLFNTWPDANGKIHFDLLPAYPSPFASGSLALGGSPEDNDGVYGVTATPARELVRAYWKSKWLYQVLPQYGTQDNPVEAGSLISGQRRVYGLTEKGQLFNTWENGSTPQFDLIGEPPLLLKRSIALGGETDTAGELWAADGDLNLVRIYWQNHQWNATVTKTTVFEDSLVSGPGGVFAVDDTVHVVFAEAGSPIQVAPVYPCPGAPLLYGVSMTFSPNARVFRMDSHTGAVLHEAPVTYQSQPLGTFVGLATCGSTHFLVSGHAQSSNGAYDYRVFTVDPDTGETLLGKPLTHAGSPFGATEGDVACDPNSGELYGVTADGTLYTITLSSGAVHEVAAVGTQYSDVSAMAFAPSGELYLLDTGRNEMIALSATYTDPPTRTALSFPVTGVGAGMTFTADGDLVTCSGGDLYDIDPATGKVVVLATQITSCAGLAR